MHHTTTYVCAKCMQIEIVLSLPGLGTPMSRKEEVVPKMARHFPNTKFNVVATSVYVSFLKKNVILEKAE